jgi:hypothetical protein
VRFGIVFTPSVKNEGAVRHSLLLPKEAEASLFSTPQQEAQNTDNLVVWTRDITQQENEEGQICIIEVESLHHSTSPKQGTTI